MRRISPALATAALTLGVPRAAATTDRPRPAADAAADRRRLPVPHAEILNYVKDNLAEKDGLELEVMEFSDYVLPNTALGRTAGRQLLPALPYLDEEEKARTQGDLGRRVHIEPLGLYSETVKDVGAVPSGAQVAIPNDATNEGRALKLLAANGVITLKAALGVGDRPRHRGQPEEPGVRGGGGRPAAAPPGGRRRRGDQRQLRARGRPPPAKDALALERPRTTRTPTAS